MLMRALPRLLVFAAIWWTLTAGEVRSWLIGTPVIVIATVAAIRLSPGQRWTVTASGVAAFVPYFLWRSLWGSVDVAWRAMHPRMPIAPAFATLVLRLPVDGPARTFFADTVNLLPGTLSARLDGEVLTVHLLNGDSETVMPELRRLEQKVARVFRVRLDPPGGTRESPHA